MFAEGNAARNSGSDQPAPGRRHRGRRANSLATLRTDRGALAEAEEGRGKGEVIPLGNDVCHGPIHVVDVAGGSGRGWGCRCRPTDTCLTGGLTSSEMCVGVDDGRGGGKGEMTRRNNEAEQGAAAGVEGAGTTLREHHAFLLRWSTSEEIGARIAEIHRIASWWASKDVPTEDDEAGSALDTALERLTTVRQTAQAVETALAEGGYEFDRHLRVLRGRRGPAVDGDVPLETAQTLLFETIVDVFELLKEQGWPDENTRELRIEIRARLAHSLHPELLSDGAIEAAVDEELNRDERIRM